MKIGSEILEIDITDIRSALAELELYLDQNNYFIIWDTILHGSQNKVWPTFDQINKYIKDIDSRTQLIFQFYAGHKSSNTLEISSIATDILIKLGLINYYNERYEFNFCIRRFMGLVLITGKNRKGAQTSPYFGEDSLHMMNIIQVPKYSTIMDLGCGTGFHGLKFSRHAKRIVFVDIDERSLLCAKLNWLWNCSDNNKAEFIHSNYFSNIKDIKFDLITFNPAFHPVANEIELPKFGGDSADGIEWIRQIFPLLLSYLNPDGRLISFATFIGDYQEPLVVKEMRSMNLEKHVRIIHTQRFSKYYYIKQLVDVARNYNSSSLNELSEYYITQFNNLNADLVYNSVLIFSKNQLSGLQTNTLSKIYDEFDLKDITGKITCEGTIITDCNGSELIELDLEGVQFIKLLKDGLGIFQAATKLVQGSFDVLRIYEEGVDLLHILSDLMD